MGMLTESENHYQKYSIIDKTKPTIQITKELYQKCLESPAYFINNCVRILDRTTGKLVKPNHVTDEQIENVVKSFKFKERIRSNPYEIMESWFVKIKELQKN